MSYCRFENTYNDLKECYDVLCENDIEDLEKEANQYEKPYIKKLIKLCREIANDFVEIQ